MSCGITSVTEPEVVPRFRQETTRKLDYESPQIEWGNSSPIFQIRLDRALSVHLPYTPSHTNVTPQRIVRLGIWLRDLVKFRQLVNDLA